MGFGTSCGPAANGRLCIVTGLVFPAACCMSGSRLGRNWASGTRSFRPWSSSIAVSAAFSGAGKPWIAGRVRRRWAAVKRVKTRPTSPNWEPKSTFWSINGVRRWPSTSVAPINMTSGPFRIWCSMSPCSAPVPSNISAVTRATTMLTCARRLAQAGYIAHIKRKRKRGEPVPDQSPAPGETQFPARRWVVERTLGWLAKRRSVRTRWCKKSTNWLALSSSLVPASCAT